MTKGRIFEARAYAKVNFGLEVLYKREDGYHEIRTILQTVDFFDQIQFSSAPEGIELKTNDPTLATGPKNLVVRAAKLLQNFSPSGLGASIFLDKKIPIGSGLGGGSADAAVTLLALQRLWGLKVSRSELFSLAVKLGMDGPFFLHGGTVFATGRGSEMHLEENELNLPIVLILPDFSISTSKAYSDLILTKRRPTLRLDNLMWGSRSVQDALSELQNHLESAAGEHSAAIEKHKQLLLDKGALFSMMSGSGSAVFGVFDDETAAHSAASCLTRSKIRAIATRTISREMYVNNLIFERS